MAGIVLLNRSYMGPDVEGIRPMTGANMTAAWRKSGGKSLKARSHFSETIRCTHWRRHLFKGRL